MRSARGLGWALLGLAVVLVGAAAGYLLWPMHYTGVGGNALRPRYHAFGWMAYSPLPAHPSRADLTAAGIPDPQRHVHHRRLVGAVLGGIGAALGLAGAAVLVVRRGQRPPG